MNYIDEINAFYDRLETSDISQSSVILWHVLMHINYKTGWKKEFAVARSVIEAKTGMKKDAYYTARNQLKINGFLDFKTRGNKAAIFTMNQLSDISSPSEIQTTNQTATQTTNPTVTQTATPTFIRSKELKEKEEDKESINPFTFYEQNFGMLSPFVIEQITLWCEELSDDLVVKSMETAIKNNKNNFKYCEVVLRDWKNKGAKSINDVLRIQQQFKSSKQPKAQNAPRGNVSPINKKKYNYSF